MRQKKLWRRVFGALLGMMGTLLATSSSLDAFAQENRSFRVFETTEQTTPERLIEKLQGVKGNQADIQISLSQNADYKRWIEDELLANLELEEQQRLLEMAQRAMSQNGIRGDSFDRIDPNSLSQAAEDFREELSQSEELKEKVSEISQVDPESQSTELSRFIRELADASPREPNQSAPNPDSFQQANSNSGSDGSRIRNSQNAEPSPSNPSPGTSGSEPGRADGGAEQTNSASDSNRLRNEGSTGNSSAQPNLGTPNSGSRTQSNSGGTNSLDQQRRETGSVDPDPLRGNRNPNDQTDRNQGRGLGEAGDGRRPNRGNSSPQFNGGDSSSNQRPRPNSLPDLNGNGQGSRASKASPPPSGLFPQNQLNERVARDMLRQLDRERNRIQEQRRQQRANQERPSANGMGADRQNGTNPQRGDDSQEQAGNGRLPNSNGGFRNSDGTQSGSSIGASGNQDGDGRPRFGANSAGQNQQSNTGPNAADPSSQSPDARPPRSPFRSPSEPPRQSQPNNPQPQRQASQASPRNEARTQEERKLELRNQMNRILLEAAKESTKSAASNGSDKEKRNAVENFLNDLVKAAEARMNETDLKQRMQESMQSNAAAIQNRSRTSQKQSSSSGEGGESSIGRGGMLVLLMLGAGALILVLILTGLKNRNSTFSKTDSPKKSFAEVQASLKNARSAEDLVAALDDYVGWRFGYRAAWWHNGQVRDGLLDEHPALKQRIEQLMATYERVRYAPETLGPDHRDLRLGVEIVQKLAQVETDANESMQRASLTSRV